jgi:cell division protein FtsB
MRKVEEKEVALERKNRELEERKRQIEEELKKLGSPNEDDENIDFHAEDYNEYEEN